VGLEGVELGGLVGLVIFGKSVLLEVGEYVGEVG
jgi:hypothetical protein